MTISVRGALKVARVFFGKYMTVGLVGDACSDIVDEFTTAPIPWPFDSGHHSRRRTPSAAPSPSWESVDRSTGYDPSREHPPTIPILDGRLRSRRRKVLSIEDIPNTPIPTLPITFIPITLTRAELDPATTTHALLDLAKTFWAPADTVHLITQAIGILLRREQVPPGIISLEIFLTRGGKVGVDTERFEDGAQVIDPGWATNDGGPANVAYFRAVRGVDLGG